MSTYSNGWGHLIMSLAVLIFAGVLLVIRAVDPTTVIGLVSTVVAFWFISGARFQAPVQPATQPIATTPVSAPAAPDPVASSGVSIP